MSANALSLVYAAVAMILLTAAVAVTMLVTRIREMKARRIHPQAVATAGAMAARLENSQAADNFRNLFETPVLFYALVAMAVGMGFVPGWLAAAAWVYVALRVAHSLIHCTYNRVMHRLAAFLPGFLLLVAMWAGYAMQLAARTTG
ncbi:MAPEG family protein [Pseudoxanthomonas koreensis]|uniref:MAPEG family protein n=1 Tax=Pseudoxanthomonas koreensis TaxID=266061 RepID=UPI0035A5A3D6